MENKNNGFQAHEEHDEEIHSIAPKTKQENIAINRYAIQRCKAVAAICPMVASSQFNTTPKVAQRIAKLSDLEIDRLADMSLPLVSLNLSEDMIENALSLDVQKRFAALASLID